MSLILKTTIISVMMIALCCLPILFHHVRRVSRFFFLAGTGALVGIVCFDLMPDVIELGGNSSLLLVFSVWIIYSAIHFFHYRHHKDHSHEDGHHHIPEKGIAVFLTSMIIHCISSGILLAISTKFNEGFSRAVFLALIAHKCYESLIVSSIVLERVSVRSRAVFAIILYSLALPLGVGLASIFSEQIGMKLAVIATSVALGSLLGCMVFDFLIPSIGHIKKSRVELAWVFLGLVLTEFMMRSHS